jgi:hypothetical protein
VKTAPGATFTTINFLCSLSMEPKYARVLHYNRLERLARYKHFSLLDPFVNYEENELL